MGYSTDGSTSGYEVEHSERGINYGMGWCSPVEGTVTTTGCRLRTFVYCVIDSASGDTLAWVPSHPDSVRFAYSLLGTSQVSDAEERPETAGSRVELVARNPMRETQAIELRLSQPAMVEAVLFDVAGRRLGTLHEGRLGAGRHLLGLSGGRVDGRALASGVYSIRVNVDGRRLVRKIVVIR